MTNKKLQKTKKDLEKLKKQFEMILNQEKEIKKEKREIEEKIANIEKEIKFEILSLSNLSIQDLEELLTDYSKKEIEENVHLHSKSEN